MSLVSSGKFWSSHLKMLVEVVIRARNTNKAKEATECQEGRWILDKVLGGGRLSEKDPAEQS